MMLLPYVSVALLSSYWHYVQAFPAVLEERAACNKDNLLNAFTNPIHSAEASTFCSAYISIPLTSTSTYLGPGTCTLYTTGYKVSTRHPLELYNLQRLPGPPTPAPISYNTASPTPVPVPGGARNYVSPAEHAKIRREVRDAPVDVPSEPTITPSPTVPVAAPVQELVKRASSSVPLPTWLSTTYPASRISSACSCISPSAAYSTTVSFNDYTQITTATCTVYPATAVKTYPAYCAPTLQANAPQPLSHANWRVTPNFAVASKMDCCDACTNVFNCVWWKFDFGSSTKPDPWSPGTCHYAYFTGNATDVKNLYTGNIPAVCPNGVTQGIDPSYPKNLQHESNINDVGYNFGACGNALGLFQSSQDFGYPDNYQDCGGLPAPYYDGQCENAI